MIMAAVNPSSFVRTDLQLRGRGRRSHQLVDFGDQRPGRARRAYAGRAGAVVLAGKGLGASAAAAESASVGLGILRRVAMLRVDS